MKYRKKPVVIEAVQLTEEMVKAYLFDKEPLPEGVKLSSAGHNPDMRKVHNFTGKIETLEGEMKVKINDWIITGVQGERYPCKPDIFAKTYELAE